MAEVLGSISGITRTRRAPLRSLWELSIQPVLAQYLAGSDRRSEELAELEQLLVTRPSS